MTNGRPDLPGGPAARPGPALDVSASFPRDVSAVGSARAWLTHHLTAFGVGSAATDDAVLVISELVTNALRHGDGPVQARCTIDGRLLRLAVTDAGEALPILQSPDPTRVGGLGLQIVDQLSVDWGVSSAPGGKTVWAMLEPRTR